MYVLMDLEWYYDKRGKIFPTQIAACRVDESWQTSDRFFSRIRPECGDAGNWNHMAFSGGKPEDFRQAPTLAAVLRELQIFLHKDDILCWWAGESPKVLERLYILLSQTPPAVPHRILLDHIIPRLAHFGISQQNPYKIAAALKLTVPTPAHCSEHDVLTIQAVLQAISFPQSDLAKPAKKRAARPSAAKGTVQADMPYQFDTNTGLLHKRGCDRIPDQAVLSGFKNFKLCFSGKAHPCRCLTEEYRQARRKRNQDIIIRSQYNFVFAKDAQIFHRRDCGCVLAANHIMGTVFYDACAKTGRRPCKLCKPVPLALMKRSSTPVPIKPPCKPVQKNLPRPEERALKRLKRSQEDRQKAPLDTMTEQERADLYTLTQPGYAFWAAAGYQNLHQRDCRKLKGLTKLRGFSRFSDAVRMGYTPCKLCKPTKKQDAVYSFPITSQNRKNESVHDLASLCEENQFSYSRDETYFTIRTSVGRWRIHLSCRPFILDHINLTKTPDNPMLYHRQPRLFLSLTDIFSYIKRHDAKLQELNRQPFEATL